MKLFKNREVVYTTVGVSFREVEHNDVNNASEWLWQKEKLKENKVSIYLAIPLCAVVCFKISKQV